MSNAMKMSQALKIIQAASRGAKPFRVVLVCGYTPLHLAVFLRARLQLALPDRYVLVDNGLYGNVAVTLESLAYDSIDAVAMTLEWEDLDPRLGFRSSGQWVPPATVHILENVRSSLQRLSNLLFQIPVGPRVAIASPSLPLPPLFHPPGFQASPAELALLKDVAEFQLHVAEQQRFAVVNPHRMAEESAYSSRYDLRSDLATGLPYSLEHADMLACLLARNIAPVAPKKGIITDLDDTLWSGIVGEVGPEAVSWDLQSHSQLHALYQKLLASLSSDGVLVGIASKNDPATVERALGRRDLLLNPDLIFPIEVHWNAKSGSVDRILKTWNISVDSVVFVDDSPMELAEVAAAHPGIETVLFPKNDVAAGLPMLRRLRDLCGKSQVSADDQIRLDSIRRGAAFRAEASSAESVPESFLQQLNATVTFDFHCANSARVLELVNKTNQFNLNGNRYTESEWQKLISAPDSVLTSLAYEDKFGPLGIISVLQGERIGRRLLTKVWVLSCRAFGRRIEHATLRKVFDCLDVDEVEFRFAATMKNQPIQDFLRALLGDPTLQRLTLERELFERNCPSLYCETRELSGAEANA